MGDRERDAALGRAVELGQHDAGHVDRLARTAAPAAGRSGRSWRRSRAAPRAARRLRRWPITRWIFRSSSIRWSCVCSRPAVSTITTSRPRDSAAATASNTTAAGSAPDCDEHEVAAGAVGPQSPAARRPRRGTCRRRRARRSCRPRCRWCASLPIDVVLPVPLTPVISTTAGRWLTSMRGSPGGVISSATISASRSAAPRRCAGLPRRTRPPAARSPRPSPPRRSRRDQRLLQPLPDVGDRPGRTSPPAAAASSPCGSSTGCRASAGTGRRGLSSASVGDRHCSVPVLNICCHDLDIRHIVECPCRSPSTPPRGAERRAAVARLRPARGRAAGRPLPGRRAARRRQATAPSGCAGSPDSATSAPPPHRCWSSGTRASPATTPPARSATWRWPARWTPSSSARPRARG